MLYGGKVERQVAREVARGLSLLAILMTRINLTFVFRGGAASRGYGYYCCTE